MQCKATSKQSSERCKRHATPTMEVCRVHGGKSLKGIGHPNYVHGGRSKYALPPNLRENFERGLADPELLTLRNEVALLDARLMELLERVDTGESGQLWKQVKGCWKDFKAAQRAKDTEKMGEAFVAIDQTIGKASSDYAAWNEVHKVINQRRILVEAERKREHELQQFVPVEQVMALARAIAEAVKREVDDPRVLRAIAVDFQKIIGSYGYMLPNGDGS